MSALDNMTEEQLEALYKELAALKIKCMNSGFLHQIKKEQHVVLSEGFEKLRERLLEQEEIIKNLRAGTSKFSKALQNIGLELVKMGINIRQTLLENKNDGKK